MATVIFTALVVDDDAIARRTVGFALSQEGFTCAYASDGDEALSRIAEEHFDLVVTDLRMPNRHGHSLAKELLSRPSPPMVVVHSSVDDPRLTKDLMLMGVADVVYKPANYKAFAAKFRGLVLRRLQVTAGSESSSNGRSSLNESAGQARSQNAKVPRAVGKDSSSGHTNPNHESGESRPFSQSNPVVENVLRLSSREDSTLSELTGIILRDPDLTKEILRVANSNNYCRSGLFTTDVREAVARIGFSKVGEIAQELNDKVLESAVETE